MSKEKEQNISRILEDVRRHSDAGQTSFASPVGFSYTGETRRASLDSFANSSGNTSDSTTSSRSQSQKLVSMAPSTQEEDEGCVGMEIEPHLTSETGLTGMVASAHSSRVEFVDSGQRSSAGAVACRSVEEGQSYFSGLPMSLT